MFVSIFWLRFEKTSSICKAYFLQITISDFLLVEQILLSPQMKQSLIISNEVSIYNSLYIGIYKMAN